MKYLTKPQLDQWLEYCFTRRQCGTILALEMLTRTGARSHELAKITIDDIDAKSATIRIIGAKGSNTREVPIDRGCAIAAYTALQATQSMAGLLGIANVESLKATLRREFRRELVNCFGVPVPSVSLHGLRASFAMIMYSGLDFDILLVKQLLGHKAISSTMHYVHAANLESRRQDIIKAMRPTRQRKEKRYDN